ncbi:MAG: SOS response-associated peptidase, partial [Pseudomonadales bacterium]|nr:SOS response-associated peptidase [Pseudomonadales bacterium]
MCGRFNLTDSPQLHDALQAFSLDGVVIPARYNIAPTEPVMTIYSQPTSALVDGEVAYTARDMRWWLTPRWVKEPSQKFAMFNARAETVASSKAFAQPFKHQRAIIPASSFIEWQTVAGHKQAYEIACEQSICLFAAIWEHWQQGDHEIYSCAILTTA